MLDQVDLSRSLSKQAYKSLAKFQTGRLYELAAEAYDARAPVVIVFEGWDAAGKGTTIRLLTGPLVPRGFKVLSTQEQLVDFGTVVFKFWMHVSKDEQKRRFDDRSAHPTKSWKLTDEDRRNREQWDLYEQAVEDMLIRTTTAQAPWTIVAGNAKYCARIRVPRTVVERLNAELHVDASPQNGQNLPPLAAPTPIPAWAVAEAAALGVTVDEVAPPALPKAKKAARTAKPRRKGDPCRYPPGSASAHSGRGQVPLLRCLSGFHQPAPLCADIGRLSS